MRILHVSQPTTAGVPNVVLDLTAHQRGLGWQVHVASPLDGYLAARAMEGGVTHHRWDALRSPGPSVGLETQRLAGIVRRVRPDVVHLHSAKAGLAGRLAIRGRRPTIFMPHAWSFESVAGPIRKASLRWEQQAARWTDLTLCVSQAEKSMGARNRCLGERTETVPNGVDLNRWQPRDRQAARAELNLPADTPLAVLVGRLSHHKGQDVAVTAWRMVMNRLPDARLVLVGDGPDREELAAQATRVTGIDLVGTADPQLWFAAADVVLMPSRWEGMPLVLLEAMASGRSVVASRVAGTAETLGDGSFLVPIQDSAALGHAVLERLLDADLRQDEEGRNRELVARSFDLGQTTARVSELAAEVAALRPTSKENQ